MHLNNKQKGLFCGVLFQLLWFICIFCPLYIVFLSSLGFLILYVNFISRRSSDFIFASGLAVIGYLIDLTWMKLGVFSLATTFPPIWLAILWLVFSLSLPYAFFFLVGRFWLAALLGGLGGGFSYVSAISFRGDAEFGVPLFWGGFYISCLWCVLFPIALKCWQSFSREVWVKAEEESA